MNVRAKQTCVRVSITGRTAALTAVADGGVVAVVVVVAAVVVVVVVVRW